MSVEEAREQVVGHEFCCDGGCSTIRDDVDRLILEVQAEMPCASWWTTHGRMMIVTCPSNREWARVRPEDREGRDYEYWGGVAREDCPSCKARESLSQMQPTTV